MLETFTFFLFNGCFRANKRLPWCRHAFSPVCVLPGFQAHALRVVSTLLYQPSCRSTAGAHTFKVSWWHSSLLKQASNLRAVTVTYYIVASLVHPHTFASHPHYQERPLSFWQGHTFHIGFFYTFCALCRAAQLRPFWPGLSRPCCFSEILWGLVRSGRLQ